MFENKMQNHDKREQSFPLCCDVTSPKLPLNMQKRNLDYIYIHLDLMFGQ